ncbi:MAG: hypothetical protein FJ031_04130 [Chloroflexi bacterium]|nr:hypothetical protein [Chloroflexota bacterium]
MIDIYSDEYWLNEFTITTADLDRFQERILREDMPLETTNLVKQIIKGRLEFGHDVSPSVLKSWTGKDSVRIWDPLAEWFVGNGIIFPKRVWDRDYDYECFVGEVIRIELHDNKIKPNQIVVHLDGQDKPVVFRYGNPAAVEVGEFSRKLVEKKYGEIEYIVMSFGNRIVSALLHALETDARFVGLEGKWYLAQKLPLMEMSLLISLYQSLLKRDNFQLDDVLPMVKVEASKNEIFSRMAIQVALQKLPERFENIGTSSHPLWRALPPHPEKAKVQYYAYDPKTYEILCSPNEPLELQKAQRLMEHNLYIFVTTFADEV